MHPWFKQVPPSFPFSIMATDFPRLAAGRVIFDPPPDPITMTSNNWVSDECDECDALDINLDYKEGTSVGQDDTVIFMTLIS